MKKEILAPMPGKILKILVEKGENIIPEQNLVILESMKMENLITTSIPGIVHDILVKENDFVKSKQLIMILNQLD
jgi:biotin carboxyl carrier protein